MGFPHQSSPANPNSASSNVSNHAPAVSGSKRAMLGSYLSSLGGTLSDKASLTNLRQVQANYDPRQSPYTLKLQLMINSSKGVIQHTDSIAKQSHRTSQSLFTWAQDHSGSMDGADLVDVGDRLAYLVYKTGDLFLEYGKSLEKARVELKEIRNFENELTKGRDRRKFLETQITRMRLDPKPRADHHDRLSTLSDELNSTTTELAALERSLAQLKRTKLKSSYSIQFDAMRELGEKLAIVGGYGDLLLDELKEPSPGVVYDGHDRTAWIRGNAAESLARYRGPLVERPQFGQPPVGLQSSSSPNSPTTNLAPSTEQRPSRDTRLFGETHREELENLLQISGHAHQHPFTDHPTPPSIAPLNINKHASSANTSLPSTGHLSPSISGSSISVDSKQPPRIPARPSSTSVGQSDHAAGVDRKGSLLNDDPSPPGSSSTKPLNYSRPTSSTSELRRVPSISPEGPSAPTVDDPPQVEDLPAYTATADATLEASPNVL